MTRPGIGKFRHRLILCSQQDEITPETGMTLNREAVQTVRAKIEAKKASTFSANGATFNESQNTRSHIIYTRFLSDLDISTYAWLYEHRAKSSDRWFKILSVNETEMSGQRFYKFDCRLHEKGDSLVPPTTEHGPAVAMPDGVVL